MKYRALITVGAWLACLLSLVTNGQAFTQALIMLGACVVGAVPWLPLLARRRDPRGRAIGFAVVGLSVVVGVGIASNLTQAYESQRRFNERPTTPGQALQAADHLDHFALSSGRVRK